MLKLESSLQSDTFDNCKLLLVPLLFKLVERYE